LATPRDLPRSPGSPIEGIINNVGPGKVGRGVIKNKWVSWKHFGRVTRRGETRSYPSAHGNLPFWVRKKAS